MTDERRDRLLRLLPDLAARGAGEARAVALTRPLTELFERVDAVGAAFADLADATGDALDVVGDAVGEARAGLGDREYRLIIAGRRAQQVGGVDLFTLHGVIRAITGGVDVVVRRTPPNGIAAYAIVTTPPSSTYLRRAGAIVRDAVAAEADVSVSLAAPLSGRYGGLPGVGIARYGYSLRTA